jgi:hypothetical protein
MLSDGLGVIELDEDDDVVDDESELDAVPSEPLQPATARVRTPARATREKARLPWEVVFRVDMSFSSDSRAVFPWSVGFSSFASRNRLRERTLPKRHQVSRRR